MKWKYFLRRGSFIPAYSFSLILWIIASLPGEELQSIQSYPENQSLRIILSDPFMHLVVFGLLTLFIYRGFYRESWMSIPLVKVALLACCFGLLVEVYQGILPWRAFGLDDLVWNNVGVLFFLAFVIVARFLMRKNVEG